MKRAERFRKLPVVIDAMLWTGDNLKEIKEFCPTAIDPVVDKLNIPTLEGLARADIGDWIIKGVAGEFYPCKPGIFQETYESVKSQDDS